MPPMVESTSGFLPDPNAAKLLMNCHVTHPAVEARLIDPLCDPEWDRLVLSHPEFSFFHCSAWARVLRKTYGHEPAYLRLSRRGELLALIPMVDVRSPWTGRRGVCLPFTDFCSPLLFGEGGTKLVMDKLTELARERQWKYIEVRGGRAPQAGATPSTAFYGHTMDLRRGPKALFAGCASSVRRAIRKAGRSGLSARVVQTRDGVLEFYRLHVQTRRRHGLPPQPVSFFLNIYHETIRAGLGFVVVASIGPRAVAAAIFFQLGSKAVFKFGASDETVQEARGNNLAMWEGIRFLAANGAETLHFGRTSLNNDGLRRFKLGWGTEEETIKYFQFEPVTGSWLTERDHATGFHNTVFRRLPVVLNRLAGTMIYPHLD